MTERFVFEMPRKHDVRGVEQSRRGSEPGIQPTLSIEPIKIAGDREERGPGPSPSRASPHFIKWRASSALITRQRDQERLKQLAQRTAAHQHQTGIWVGSES